MILKIKYATNFKLILQKVSSKTSYGNEMIFRAVTYEQDPNCRTLIC